jgi:hypothetical protein
LPIKKLAYQNDEKEEKSDAAEINYYNKGVNFKMMKGKTLQQS